MGRNEGGSGRNVNSLFGFGRREPVDTTAYGAAVAGEIKAFEDSIANMDIEQARVIRTDGSVILDKTGQRDYVEFTRSEVDQMKDGIFMHNHPYESGWGGLDGGTFSPDDLVLATMRDVREMRAVSQEYTHSMQRPDRGWPPYRRAVGYYTNQLDLFNRDLDNRLFWSHVRGRPMTENAYMREYMENAHKAMINTSSRFGFIYERRSRTTGAIVE